MNHVGQRRGGRRKAEGGAGRLAGVSNPLLGRQRQCKYIARRPTHRTKALRDEIQGTPTCTINLAALCSLIFSYDLNAISPANSIVVYL